MSTGINGLEALVMPKKDRNWTNLQSKLECYELLVVGQKFWAEEWGQVCDVTSGACDQVDKLLHFLILIKALPFLSLPKATL